MAFEPGEYGRGNRSGSYAGENAKSVGEDVGDVWGVRGEDAAFRRKAGRLLFIARSEYVEEVKRDLMLQKMHLTNYMDSNKIKVRTGRRMF